MNRRRIGIMGGTLDPVHDGHLHMARYALDALQLDVVLMLPSGNPPHKPDIIPAVHRWRMLSLACTGVPGLEMCREEIDRQGVIFTVDTLASLREKYPRAEFFYLIGADTLMELKKWREYGRVLRLTKFAVCPRSTRYTLEELDAERDRLTLLGGDIRYLDMPAIDVSSTAVREAIASGKPAPHLSPLVQEYAEIYGLYGAVPRIPEAAAWLDRVHDDLTVKRFAHALGVAATARRLALLHGLDADRAEAAGLLHDCVKCWPLERMQRVARENALTDDEAILASGAMLHSVVGEYVARTVYGVTDPAILSAIRWHTTGTPGMTRLDMAVWLADAIEPTREDYPGLAELRSLAEVSLEKAIEKSLDSTLRYVRQKGLSVHPATADTLAWLRTLPACQP
ncbi:MAG: nicotinate-nucleotide adenylyltransferase [Clostridia bacterium]|nr:nicotinate-nucleotide adenylyltransferase [Clostridia bacterium]